MSCIKEKLPIIKIAKRDNNAKRPYLLVNPLQGKHIPVSPNLALSLFHSLAELMYAKYKKEKLLLIGFAETATAIGAAIACESLEGVYYIHTTREEVLGGKSLYFSEVHSHAVEQKLVKNQLTQMIEKTDRILFIEDEVTTGNTILNLIHALQNEYTKKPLRFGIVSLVNSMSDENIEYFNRQGVDCTYLLPLPQQDYTACLEAYSFGKDAALKEVKNKINKQLYRSFVFSGRENPRIGVSSKEYCKRCNDLVQQVMELSKKEHWRGKSLLVLGAEEFMYPALLAAKALEDSTSFQEVLFHATTRSPILPCDEEEYPIKSRYQLASIYDKNRKTFLYNLKRYDKVLFFHDAEKESSEGLNTIVCALKANGCEDITAVKWADGMKSSYQAEDVTILLKDITGLVEPMSTEEREKCIQKGISYSEMLPLEYQPSPQYLKAYELALKNYAKPTADAVCHTAEKIYSIKGKHVVLVSLARAGIPVGILLAHYLREKYKIEACHYSISIIRGRGIDKNALRYILDRHKPSEIQFVDGWIGKGAIQNQLKEALKEYPDISEDLAVLSDPANLTDLCGTHQDILIPSSCLNAPVSGLISRTFLRKDIISNTDFHGAAYYKEWETQDLSYNFLSSIENYFNFDIKPRFLPKRQSGRVEIQGIAETFGVRDINLIKPGIGETTRVLLRRSPWKILIQEEGEKDPMLSHLLQLAEDKKISVVQYPLKNYKACGIIRNLADA